MALTSSEFDGVALDSPLYWDDPLSGCTITYEGDHVEVTVPDDATYHCWRNGNNDAPKIWQPLGVSEDFAVTLYTSAINAGAWDDYVTLLGLVVEESDTSFLRACIYAQNNNTEMLIAHVADDGSNGTDNNGAITVPGNEIWQRLVRVGDDYTHSYSTNGTDFTAFAAYEWTGSPVRIGIVAGRDDYSGPNVVQIHSIEFDSDPLGGGGSPAPLALGPLKL